MGNWISGFSRKRGTTTNLKAKLYTMYYGLHKAWNEGFSFVLWESNSKLALDLIQHYANSFHPYFFLITSIHELIFGVDFFFS